jgi:hypothetical protein
MSAQEFRPARCPDLMGQGPFPRFTLVTAAPGNQPTHFTVGGRKEPPLIGVVWAGLHAGPQIAVSK